MARIKSPRGRPDRDHWTVPIPLVEEISCDEEASLAHAFAQAWARLRALREAAQPVGRRDMIHLRRFLVPAEGPDDD